MWDVNTKDTFCDVLPENTSRLFICFCVRCESASLASIRDDGSLKRLTITNNLYVANLKGGFLARPSLLPPSSFQNVKLA
jgi:hypothetical protein